jgi:preprotein translocase subunit YajC
MMNFLQAAEVATTATEAAAPGQPGAGSFWIMMLLMLVVMYFFMWRPESKRRKEMAKFREGLKKGDKIITAGGIYGVVKEVNERDILMEVDGNVTLRVDKSAIMRDPRG